MTSHSRSGPFALPRGHAARAETSGAAAPALPAGRRNFMTQDSAAADRLYVGAGTPEATMDAMAPLAARLVDNAYLIDAQAGSMPAGYTFLAQLLAHDISATTPAVGEPGDPVPATGPTLRVNGLLLDSIFGPIGADEPKLFRFRASASDPARPVAVDLQWQGDSPKVADKRNADTPMLAQLAALFIALYGHARTVLLARHAPADASRLARGVTAGVYHAILRNDLLPRLLHPSVWAQYRRPDWPMADTAGARDGAFLPVEFTNAAFRFGHAMVRATYLLNDRSPPLPLGELTRGFAGLAEQRAINSNFWRVDWRQFFDLGATPQMSRRIGPNVPPDLEKVTVLLRAATRFPTSSAGKNDIALKDLARGVGACLQSVSAMAEALRPHLADKQDMGSFALWDATKRGALVRTWLEAAPGAVPAHLLTDPPPYLYILIEAGSSSTAKGGGKGRRLGALGSAIAAEAVLPKLKQGERYLQADADLPAARAEVLGAGRGPDTMPELIRFLTKLN